MRTKRIVTNAFAATAIAADAAGAPATV